jgi:hypothetical protein
MAITYEPIATTTLGSAAGTVSFTSISAAYTDIFVVINATTVSSSYGLWYRVNNDSGNNYSYTMLYGNGTSALSTRESSISRALGANDVSTTISTNTIHFMNYSNTTTYKTAISRGSSSSESVQAIVSLWRSTSAINRIDFAPGASFPTGQFASGSTFTLYGIKAA